LNYLTEIIEIPLLDPEYNEEVESSLDQEFAFSQFLDPKLSEDILIQDCVNDWKIARDLEIFINQEKRLILRLNITYSKTQNYILQSSIHFKQI